MQPMLNIGVRAARRAGDIIIRSQNRLNEINSKKKGKLDYVTDTDREAESAIIETLLTAYPEHQIIAEETGTSGNSEFQWIIDPLDGTLNFLHGYPHFCVSIALSKNNRLQHAVVYDPVRDELFTASRGDGALLNGNKIRVSSKVKLEDALIATGISVRNPEGPGKAHDSIKNIINAGADIRRSGSAALDMAYVASGRVDGYWETGLHSWDLAAGALLIIESGGIVCDEHGGEDYLKKGSVFTGPPKLLKQLLSKIN